MADEESKLAPCICFQHDPSKIAPGCPRHDAGSQPKFQTCDEFADTGCVKPARHDGCCAVPITDPVDLERITGIPDGLQATCNADVQSVSSRESEITPSNSETPLGAGERTEHEHSNVSDRTADELPACDRHKPDHDQDCIACEAVVVVIEAAKKTLMEANKCDDASPAADASICIGESDVATGREATGRQSSLSPSDDDLARWAQWQRDQGNTRNAAALESMRQQSNLPVAGRHTAPCSMCNSGKRLPADHKCENCGRVDGRGFWLYHKPVVSEPQLDAEGADHPCPRSGCGMCLVCDARDERNALRAAINKAMHADTWEDAVLALMQVQAP